MISCFNSSDCLFYSYVMYYVMLPVCRSKVYILFTQFVNTIMHAILTTGLGVIKVVVSVSTDPILSGIYLQ